MRHLIITLCALSALTAACDGDRNVRITSRTSDDDANGVLKVIDALQCPQTMGSLTRKGSAQAEGSVCTYSGPKGAEVSLHLVELDGGSPDALLKSFEDRLNADLPHTAATMRASSDAEAARAEAEAAHAEALAANAEANAAAETAAASAADQARVDMPGMHVDAKGDKATVRMPGINIDADGDKASVRIGGFSINADDGSQDVNISSNDESISVQAHDNAAEIRTSAPGDATRSTYILTDDQASAAGWRLVGYEARGPAGGPIVVATVRAKDRHNDGVFDDAKDLVSLNVGE